MNLITALNAWAERRQRRYELRVLDRAQRRAMSMRRPTSSRLSFRDWLALLLVIAFMSVIFFLLKWAFPKQNEQLIVYMLGQLSGFTATAIALYYTLSKHDETSSERRADERDKTLEVVKTLAENVTNTPSGDGPSGNPGDPVHVTEEEKNHA